jgi:PAS domain S-box-containing protein
LVYAVAVLSAVAAATVRTALDPLFGDRIPYTTFFIAVVVSAWLGGLRPALIAGGLGFGFAWFLFVPPKYSFRIPDDTAHLLGLFMYLLVSLAIAVFGEAMWAARRKAEHSGELLKQTLESITDGFVRLDRDWNVVYLNAEAERIHRIPAAETLGRSIWALFPEIAGTRLEAELRRCASERNALELEYFHPPHQSWYALKMYPMREGGLVLFFRDITEQKGQREALAESTARLRHLADAMPQIVFAASPAGHFNFINRRWEEYTGYANVDKEHMACLVHPGDVPRLGELWKKTMKTGDPVETEFRLRRADGEFRWFLSRSVPIRDSEGRIVQWYGTCTDIHLQKLDGERLRRSEERYRALFESMDEGYCVIEMLFDDAGNPCDYIFHEINPAFGKQTGLVDAKGRRARELVPALEAFWFETYGRVAATGEPIRFENRAEAMGRWFDVYAFRVGPPEARRVAILFSDITLRKRTEEALRQKVEELQTLMDTLPIGVFVAHDPECRTITGNAAALAMFRSRRANLSKSAPEGERPVHFRVMQNGIEIPAENLPVQRAARGEPVQNEELDDVFDDGTVLHTLMSAAPLRDADGRVRGAVASVLDVTQRKHAENALRDADRRKDEFLAMLAHELRNPLAPIRNGLEILRLAKLSGTAEQARAMMDRQLNQLVRLVDDLLDISRITLGKMELRRDEVDCRTVIETAVEAARPAIDQAGHHLEVDVPEGAIRLNGDAVRLSQVVSNLLNNAAKYTPAGGRIRVSAAMEGEVVAIRVADNGLGIPGPMLQRVFEIFTQLDRRLEKTTGGLGLGLSLVKGLVEMHGGTVEAHSDGEGRGSEFTVRLPAVAVAERGAAKAAAETAAAPRCFRILVVDDNRDAADSLGQLLEILGHEVRTAYDGESGIAAAEAFRPGVVLMDLGMPKVNGFDAARRIRQQEWGGRMVIVALTGWGQSEDKLKSADAGFDHHLVKPVEADTLMKLLDGVGDQ